MKYKLICFDLDGTIIDDVVFIWDTIHDHYNIPKSKRQEAVEDFVSGKISYQQWANHDCKLLMAVGATKQGLLDSLKRMKLMKGAMETLEDLKNSGMKLALISGGIDFALDHMIPSNKEIFDDIFINYFIFDKKGKLIRINGTKYDCEHKATALKEIAKREKIKLSECVFIGDNHNDAHAAKAAGLSIAFNSKSEQLNEICDIVIKEKDLRLILKHVK